MLLATAFHSHRNFRNHINFDLTPLLSSSFHFIGKSRTEDCARATRQQHHDPFPCPCCARSSVRSQLLNFGVASNSFSKQSSVRHSHLFARAKNCMLSTCAYVWIFWERTSCSLAQGGSKPSSIVLLFTAMANESFITCNLYNCFG